MLKKLPFCAVLLLASWRSLPAEDVGTVPPADPAYFALTGATIVVGNGEVLENGTLVIRDGLIESVGTDAPAPAGAWKIDASGMFVYPGLIDTLNTDAFKSERAGGPPQTGARGGRGGPPQPASTEGPGYFAHISAADHLESDSKLAAWREAGVLAVNAAPTEGIFRGRAALANLNGREADQMLVRTDTGMYLSFRGLGFRTYPGSLMGVIAHIRQTLSDAAHYRLAWAEYDKNHRGLKRPDIDRTLRALGPVVEGRLPLIFPASTEREIKRSLALCQESRTHCVIAGGYEAPAVAERLKSERVPVLVSLNFPKPPRDLHPDDEESLEAVRHRSEARKAAARLSEAGVPFAFASDGAGSGDFLSNIRVAVDKGLSKDAALRAATLSAAEILGTADQLGSLETGKIANVLVSDKELFDEKAKIKHIFVDGVHFEPPAQEEKKKANGGGKAVDLSGEWEGTVSSPGGDFKLTFSLKQEGEVLGGTVTSEQGVRTIQEGSVSGDSFSFRIETDMGGGPVEVTFSGTATADRLSGSASLGQLGAAPLEARRVP